MLHEFAFDPRTSASWSHLERLFAQCGFRYGRLVSEYPRHWKQLVLASRDWQPVERLRVVSRLAKVTVITLDRNDSRYIEGQWLESAETESPAFRAIVSVDNPRNCSTVLISDQVDDDTPLWC